jgi:hypothetical protein
MAEFHIVCVDREEVRTGHDHIVQVGTGGALDRITSWTVAEVIARLETDSFYTTGGGDKAYVHPYNCECGFETIRSAPDDTTADNLDDLSPC